MTRSGWSARKRDCLYEEGAQSSKIVPIAMHAHLLGRSDRTQDIKRLME
jgi:hypothetical protein